MAYYPCTDDPSEIIQAVVETQGNAEKLDRFVNGGVYEEVQLGEGQPTPTLRNLSHLVKSAAATLDGADVSGKVSDAANGGETLRMLSDRFGDIVNVKDFGAVGDGVTDDTEAIKAAIAAAGERSVFFPDGEYVISENIAADNLVSTGNAYASGGRMAIANANRQDFIKNSSKRRILFTIPYFDEYDSINNGYSGFSAQSFAVTKSYVLLLFCGTATVVADSKLWIAVFSKTGNLLTFFSLGYVGISHQTQQMLHAEETNATLTFWGIHVQNRGDDINGIGKYVVNKNSLPAKYSEISPSEFYPNLTSILTGFHLGKEFYVQSDSNGYGVRIEDSIFLRYDEEFNLKGWTQLNGVETTFPTAPLGNQVNPKQQSFAGGDGFIAVGCGSYYNTSYETINKTQYQGIKLYTTNFQKIFSVLYRPDLFCEIMSDALGTSVTRSENEGVSVCDGRIYSLVTVGSSVQGTEHLYCVFEEFSDATDAVDFSAAVVTDTTVEPTMLSGSVLPRLKYGENRDIRYLSPYDGTPFTNIADIMDYMATHLQHQMSIGTDDNAIPMTDIDGSEFPQHTLLRFTLLKKNEILLEVIGCKQRNNSKPSWRLFNGGYGEWYEMDTNLIEASFHDVILGKIGPDSCYGRLKYLKPDGTAVNGIYYETVENDYSYLFIGNNDPSEYPVDAVKIFSNIGSYDDRIVGGVGLVSKYFRPEATDSISLGNSSLRWENIYASSGAVSTSDERVKTDVSAVDEAVLRAWGKISFKVFRFISAVREKGGSARRHVGLIAQDVQAAFAAEGLDASEYGLFCYDEWAAQDAVVDREGNVVEPAREQGSIYGIRYEEALALECAYQRWLGERREARIVALEARLNEISGNDTAPSGASPDNL